MAASLFCCRSAGHPWAVLPALVCDVKEALVVIHWQGKQYAGSTLDNTCIACTAAPCQSCMGLLASSLPVATSQFSTT